mmetsp:Transcript_36065/g.86837  ORF Transcript_36065/g.86837 Transcript_36065/m.86837 type:complete len:201 (-) Transcript_36065:625-1227(-)
MLPHGWRRDAIWRSTCPGFAGADNRGLRASGGQRGLAPQGTAGCYQHQGGPRGPGPPGLGRPPVHHHRGEPRERLPRGGGHPADGGLRLPHRAPRGDEDGAADRPGPVRGGDRPPRGDAAGEGPGPGGEGDAPDRGLRCLPRGGAGPVPGGAGRADALRAAGGAARCGRSPDEEAAHRGGHAGGCPGFAHGVAGLWGSLR